MHQSICRAYFIFYILLAPGLLCLIEPLSAEEPETIVRDILERTEQTGVKIGMTKEEVIEILGEEFSEEKISEEIIGENVYTWQKNSTDKLTVTFSSGKVRAVSHYLRNTGNK